MDQFTEKLTSFGLWAGNNKYLGSIRDAFQTYMPFTIVGAVGTLWTCVIVNNSTGLGAFIPQVMALEFLNPAFTALNFCTIGVITIGITFAIGMEIGKRNNLEGYLPGIIAIAALLSVTNTTQVTSSLAVTLADGTATTLTELLPQGAQVASVSAISTDVLGATGLFTGMILGILSVELLTFFSKFEKLKIKLPDSVPPNIAGSFNVLLPSGFTLIITSLIGLLCEMTTGLYLNDLVFNIVQVPLQNVGGSFIGGFIFVLVISLFWCVGIHGNNMTNAITSPLLLALLLENEAAVNAGKMPTNIINQSFWSCFITFAGTGIAGAMTLAILIAAKREDNRAIAKLALIPNCFNINEINVFGLPVVLNPIMCTGFVLAPLASYVTAYVLSAIGICPIMYINVPWTTPPIIAGFIASGGKFMGGLTQLICLAVATVVYIPCIKLYEKQQNKND
jgi:PTS system cellobiose-specific IIC component